MTTFVPWKRAVEGAVLVAVIQFFIYYFQFVVTDCIPLTLVLVKSFLVTPVLIFLINLAQFSLLNLACCQTAKDEATKIIAFGGITKALVVTWATTPLAAVTSIRSAALILATFLVAVAVFFLVGFETEANLKQL
jgi:hypothetical protein